MKSVTHSRPSCFWHRHELFQALAAKVVLIHFRQAWGENRMIIRFENGYGVTILPVSLEEEVFEMLVLRFYGAEINDYQVAQYAPIPELNRGNFDEIMDLCKQVSLSPKIQPITVAPGQSRVEIKKGELERRCSNSHRTVALRAVAAWQYPTLP